MRGNGYNPSSQNSRIQIALLAAIATLIALYLSLYQWHVIDTVWDPIFGDGTSLVLTSHLSHDFTDWIRLPDASLGFFAYLSDVIFSLGGSLDRWKDRPWLVIVFGIAVIPAGIVSIILVCLQGLIVQSWCFLCLMSAVISLILIGLAYGEVMASCMYLHEIKKRTSSKTAWWALWGYPCEESLSAAEAIIERKTGNVGKNR